MIGIDFETTALRPEEGRVRLVQAHDGERTLVVDTFKCDPRPLLEQIAHENLVAHNANFEELWLWHEFCLDIPIADDTMIMSQVLYGGTENFKRIKHGLADVAKRELGEQEDDSHTADAGALRDMKQNFREFHTFHALG
jgi:ribonuclease D